MRLPLMLAVTALVPAALAAQTLSPGKWDSRSTVSEVTIKGASPAIAKGVAGMLQGKTQTRSACFAAGAPPLSLFVAPGATCKWSKAQVSGGRIDAAGSCSSPKGSVAVTLTGSYTADSYSVRSRLNTPTPAGPMTLVADATGKRSGACG